MSVQACFESYRRAAAVDRLVDIIRLCVAIGAIAQKAEERKWDPPPGQWVDGGGVTRNLCDLSDRHLANIQRMLLRVISEDREIVDEYEDAFESDVVAGASATAALERLARRNRKLIQVSAEQRARRLLQKRHIYRLATAMLARADLDGWVEGVSDMIADGHHVSVDIDHKTICWSVR